MAKDRLRKGNRLRRSFSLPTKYPGFMITNPPGTQAILSQVSRPVKRDRLLFIVFVVTNALSTTSYFVPSIVGWFPVEHLEVWTPILAEEQLFWGRGLLGVNIVCFSSVGWLLLIWESESWSSVGLHISFFYWSRMLKIKKITFHWSLAPFCSCPCNWRQYCFTDVSPDS